MTEQNSNEKSLIKAQAQEIQSLNFDGLDVSELEKRMEMATFNVEDEVPTCGTLICAFYYPTV